MSAKIGLLSLVNHKVNGSRAAISELLRDQVAQAKLAEEVGLHSFWIAEHHAGPHGGLVPSNAILAAAVAASTRRIRIGAGAALLTLHDPFELAEQWAMVDCLSSGRVEFGMGRAFLPGEFALFGSDMDESRLRFEESITLITQLWRGEETAFSGRYRTLPPMRQLTPLPLQSPHPPLWVTASMSLESFVFAGRQGYGLIVTPWAMGLEGIMPLLSAYCEAYEQAGHDPKNRRIQASYHALIHSDRKLAIEKMRHSFGVAMQMFVEVLQSVPFTGEAYASYAAMAAGLNGIDVDQIIQNGRVIVGTPEDTVAQLIGFRQKAPMITDWTLGVDFGFLERELVYQTIKHLGRDCLPKLY